MAQRAGDIGRHVLRAAVPAVLGALVAAMLISPSDDTFTATSRVAVSDSVGWPFYTSSRERILEIAGEEDLQAAVRQQVAADQVELDAEATEGQIIVELSAEAPSEEAAVEAANLYAQQVVAAGMRQDQQRQQQRIDDLEAAIATIDQRIAANDAEIAAISAALEAEPAEPEAAVLRSRRQRLEASQRQDAVEHTQLIQDLTSAQLASDDIESEIELLRPATSAATGVSDDPLAVALVAAIPLFLLGIGASVLWDQTLGHVRNPSDVRWATRAPAAIVSFSGPPDAPEAYGAGSVARRLLRRDVPGCRWVLVPIGPVAAAPLAEHLTRILERGGSGGDGASAGWDEPVGSLAVGPSGGTRLEAAPRSIEGGTRVDVREDGSDLEVADEEGVAAACGAVLAVAAGRTRLPAIRQAVRDLEVEGLNIEAVIVLAPGRP